MKPGGGVHGGGVQERGSDARERGMESGEASEGWGSSGARLEKQGHDRVVGHMAVVCGNGGSMLMHGCHAEATWNP